MAKTVIQAQVPKLFNGLVPHISFIVDHETAGKK
jgi:hypothetical protein